MTGTLDLAIPVNALPLGLLLSVLLMRAGLTAAPLTCPGLQSIYRTIFTTCQA